jgi:ubiquinone biosynthesis protein
MTRPVTHIYRLLKWGRILAKHGALRGIEGDPNVPPPVKRLCRVARFGTIQPKVPDYAAAFTAIGPAAIKLGQTLATRPDLIGEEAARNLLSLQDQLPPEDYGKIVEQIEIGLGGPVAQFFSEIDPEPIGSASIAQVHRAVTTEVQASTRVSSKTSKPMNGPQPMSNHWAAKSRVSARA